MALPEREFERPKGAPMWIVTFTDMISLLLTFFIMILTFSSMEEEKMQQATGSMAGAFGVMSKPGHPARTETNTSLSYKFRERDKKGVTDPSIRKDQVNDAIRKVQDRAKFNIAIRKRDLENETLISLTPQGDDELFALGSNRPSGRTNMLLREMARMFKDLPVRISVETHIDSKTPKLIGETPRTLTLGMALSAASIFVEEGFAPERVAATPKGDFFPVAGNEKPLDRFRNRRLEIRVLPTWRDEIHREAGGK